MRLNCVIWSIEKIATNITVDSVSLRLKEKKSGNKNNEKDNCQINLYNGTETNKSADKNKIKQNKNMSKQTETRASNKSKLSYPNNPPLLIQQLGEYSSSHFESFTTKHHEHTNRSGVETT